MLARAEWSSEGDLVDMQCLPEENYCLTHSRTRRRLGADSISQSNRVCPS